MSDKLSRRLVVTGHDAEGCSRIASDTVVRGQEVPDGRGMELSLIWGSDTKMHYPDDGAKPKYEEYFPPLDGYRLSECYMPAGYVPPGGMSAGGEKAPAIDQALPGITHIMDADRPGMHRTPTVDLIIVLEGRCVLKLDKGEVELNAGDILVESGTIHAWINPFDEPCRFLCTIIGARNDYCQ